MEQHNVVVIGGGHNGLIVAAYLAKAGLDVCVVERQDKVGGGAITRELTLPGFKHDPFSVLHAVISGNPLIQRDELGLKSKYGLKYIFPEITFAVIFPEDKALVFYHDIDKTCESISQFSERDAEAYREMVISFNQMLKVASIAASSVPPPFGRIMSFLDTSDEGRQFMKLILSSALDVAEDWFESDQVKIALCRFASEHMIGPQEKGTGNDMIFVSSLHSRGYPLPVGGSGALSEALAACIRDNGGTIKLSSTVKSIKVEAGEARGVVLDTGEEIMASKAVVSNLNVKQLFLEMLKPEELPPNFQTAVRHIKHSSFSAMNQAIALNEALKTKVGGDADKALFLEIAPSSIEEFLRSFEEYRYGIVNTNMPLMVTATLFDPSRAPKGKHTLYLYHYEPYALKDGGAGKWDKIKQEVADGILETVRSQTTNLGPENILGRWIASPLDLERYNPAFRAGDIIHIGQFITQFFANRPLPGWGQYKTPINRLYMCGASNHPGVGISGGGRATTQVIMEDLGIDFKKVIAT